MVVDDALRIDSAGGGTGIQALVHARALGVRGAHAVGGAVGVDDALGPAVRGVADVPGKAAADGLAVGLAALRVLATRARDARALRRRRLFWGCEKG